MSMLSYFGIKGACTADKIEEALDKQAVAPTKEDMDYALKILCALTTIPQTIISLMHNSEVRYDTVRKYIAELSERHYALAVFPGDSMKAKPKYVVTDKGVEYRNSRIAELKKEQKK